ncbi:MAG: ABC transporter ATP-binding protein [Coriobacteriales bacterium]|jgi:iron complex transport system ATP-binding protein|nr:ABC transporter ATP-binding protein [Coriobacteriales bacterium]
MATDTTSGTAALRFANLTFSYRREPFIRDFGLAVHEGLVTGIIGPNGCGKSTLTRLAVGLERPQSGEVLIEGRPTLSFKPRERARHLAYLTQGGNQPAMSVEGLVACGRFPSHGHQGPLDAHDRALVDEAMRRCGVERFRDVDVRRLSGGERQRAFIAMTLAQDTRIIVLDEPTTFLDVHACHETMLLLRQLNRNDGKTVVVIIHDLDLALRYSDRLAVMTHGRLLQEGTVPEVLASRAIEEAFHVSVHPNPAPAPDASPSYSLHPTM